MKLALGCVQFGLDYGVTNSSGQVPLEEARRILCYATQVGIDTLDTAAMYGNSEQVLGSLLKPFNSEFNIVTKLGHVTTKTELVKSFNNSLSLLNQSQVSGLMLHRPEVLLSKEGSVIASTLAALKAEGKISHWGVSVYDPIQTKTITERYKIDLVQLPLNVFDQRFASSGMLKQLNEQGVRIHARSILLQGLLCQSQWPSYFSPWQAQRLAYQKLAKQHQLTLLQLALSFCHSQPLVERFVLGCQSVAQLNEIVMAYKKSQGQEVINFAELANTDIKLIIPSNWPTNKQRA
ncbi:aldo/keto reductase [Motilimonas sp. 1_MG-2023]|uniref:aldo/keto reductase n=1 Tax=Motilimonas TaxID=1914248 RepID=UPI0026E415F4|nr:aldo/keto reductase [Motilimonas sp. 1_MG-2023]MDO6524969.1 aldo/keto reductase [Motilimonas sp. 1_MG-2023]